MKRQFPFLIEEEDLKKLKERAAEDGRSITGLIRKIILDYLKDE